MNWQWTAYTIFLSTAAFISFISGGYVWYRFRHKPAARMGVMLIIAVGWWLLGSVLEVSSVRIENKIFWDKAQFIAIVAIPAGWLTYVLRYVGKANKLTRRRFILLWLIPCITLLLVYTNEWHGLIWASYELTAIDGVIVKVLTYGPGFWLFLIHANILILAGVVHMLRTMLISGRLYRWQVLALTVAVIVPWVVDVASILFGWRPFLGIDLTPFALAITVSAAGWTVYRLQVRDIGPAARHLLIDQMGDGVLVLDNEHCIIDANPALLSLLQKSLSQLSGRPISQFWPDWPQPLLDANWEEGMQMEWSLGGAAARVFDVRMSPMFDGRHQLVSWVIVLRDIGERKQIEDRLRTSLHEKEVLLKEIHHRVKNNLQIISSMLNLQASQAADEAVLQALLEGQTRVRSMALIHEVLYQSGDLARIDFGTYVRELTSQLYQAYNMHTGPVAITVQTDAVFLSMETAVPCGLILNELVSNALKHAFCDGRSGQINIYLQAPGHARYQLTVSDDGIGFPSHLDYRQTTTLGLQLVNSLVEQLEGELTIANHQGTSITITFADRLIKGAV